MAFCSAGKLSKVKLTLQIGWPPAVFESGRGSDIPIRLIVIQAFLRNRKNNIFRWGGFDCVSH